MKAKPVLTAASIYLGLIGLALMFVPAQFGIAVLNWLARDWQPSHALDVVLISNLVGFACVTAMDVWGTFSGTARSAGKIFLVVHLLFVIAFVIARRGIITAGNARHP